MFKRFFFTILFISWLVVITLLSLSSLSSLGNVAKTVDIPHIDKLVHFTFYFVAIIFGSFSLKEFKENKISLNRASNTMILFSIFYGMIIEILQYGFTSNRHGDFFDFLANSTGALCGWLVIKYLISHQVAQK